MSTLPITRFCFVRHGHAAGVEGRCIGQSDVALSAAGETAIRDLMACGETRMPVADASSTTLVSSDLRRARDSPVIIAAILGCPIICDARLREASFGEWDGRLWANIEHTDSVRFHAWMKDWMNVAPPGGETVTEVLHRVVAWIDEVRSTQMTEQRTLLVVSHAGWIRLAVSYLLGRPVESMFDLPVDWAGVTIVEVRGTECRLVASNVRRPSRNWWATDGAVTASEVSPR